MLRNSEETSVSTQHLLQKIKIGPPGLIKFEMHLTILYIRESDGATARILEICESRNSWVPRLGGFLSVSKQKAPNTARMMTSGGS